MIKPEVQRLVCLYFCLLLGTRLDDSYRPTSHSDIPEDIESWNFFTSQKNQEQNIDIQPSKNPT